jgi:translation initiation factor 3 subunit L
MSNEQLLQAAQREKGGKGGKKGDRERGERGRGGESKGEDAEEVVFELPVNWLWDLIDEFVYQFESFSLFRSRSSSKLTQDELQVIADNPDVWDAHTVLRYLHAMVRKAGIEVNAAQPAASAAGIASMFSTLGHFSLVGLLRVHVLLCDYSSALQVLAPLDLKLHKTLLSSVPSCYLSLYYHLGYAYLMLHRYVDALRILSYYVVYKQRNKHVQHKLSSTPSMQSRLDRLQGLLALAFAVSPDTLDDAVLSELKDKHGDRWQRLQRFDLTVFEDIFFQCSPKALLLSPQPQSASASASSAAASSPFSQTPHELVACCAAGFQRPVDARNRRAENRRRAA